MIYCTISSGKKCEVFGQKKKFQSMSTFHIFFSFFSAQSFPPDAQKLASVHDHFIASANNPVITPGLFESHFTIYVVYFD
jgi:hypothetical protein